MGIIDKIKGIVSGKKDISVISGEQLQANLLQQALFKYANKYGAVMSTNPVGLINNSFLKNSTVYSIVNHRCKAASSVPWMLYEVTNQKAYIRALQVKHAMLNPTDGRPAMNMPLWALFQKSDIKEVPNSKIYDIMEQPNPRQTWADLTESYIGYISLTGNAYEYGTGPRAGANKGQFHQIQPLPAQLTQIVPDGESPTWVKEYIVRYMYENAIPAEQVSHIKYWNPSFGEDYTQLYGLSPIAASRYTVQQSNDNSTAMLALLQNVGALGIIAAKSFTNDESSFTQEQAENIKTKWQERYSGAENYGRIAFTPGSVEWHQLGLSPVDLAIIESENMSDRKISSVFSFPSLLIGDSTQKTFNNYREAKKALYTDCVIPDLIKLKEARNRWFLRPFAQAENKKLIFDLDYTAVPELQDDVKDIISAYKDAWWLTANERRLVMRYGELPLEEANKLYIPSSYVDIQDMNAAMDTGNNQIDQTLKHLSKQGISDYE